MNICLIGCGKMGSSLIEGWLSLKEIKHISVIEPNLAKIQKKKLNNKNFNFYEKLEDVDRSIFFDVTSKDIRFSDQFRSPVLTAS